MPVIPAPPEPTHDLGGTRFTTLAAPSRGSSETSMWRVSIDPGVEPTPHAVTREEIFLVLAGVADVEIDGERWSAKPGDVIAIPAGVRFALSNALDHPLELLCCLPVGGQAVTGAGTFTPPWAQ
jgi:quercetin dioxygenase-like cupin family protein